MNKTLSTSSTRRFFISLRLVLNQLFSTTKAGVERLGDFFFNMLLYRGRPGAISFNVPMEEADGFIRQIVRGDDGRYRFEEMTYRIFNRWLVKPHSNPAPRLLMAIKTDAETNWGYRVHSVTWGVNAWNRKEACPFDTSKLPSEAEIHARHEKRRKIHDFLAAVFPSRHQLPRMGLRDQARDIILR